MATASIHPGTRLTASASRRIGLLAGWGRFPIVVAQALVAQGYEVVGVGVKHHADPQLVPWCAEFTWIGVAQIGAMIRYFRRQGLREVTFAGKIFKTRLFERGAFLRHLPDLRTFSMFAKHFLTSRGNRRDDTLLLSVVREFAKDGLHIAPATDFAPDLLVNFQQLSRRAPSASEAADIQYGWQLAKEIGRHDVGQCVVVKGRTAIAVEAIEGTDACIERAGQLCRSGGLTVVKVAKPAQDMRFDVPTVGLGTLETLVRSGARCLAVEAHRTILLDLSEVVRYADQHRVALVSLDSSGQLPPVVSTTADHTAFPETPSA